MESLKYLKEKKERLKANRPLTNEEKNLKLRIKEREKVLKMINEYDEDSEGVLRQIKDRIEGEECQVSTKSVMKIIENLEKEHQEDNGCADPQCCCFYIGSDEHSYLYYKIRDAVKDTHDTESVPEGCGKDFIYKKNKTLDDGTLSSDPLIINCSRHFLCKACQKDIKKELKFDEDRLFSILQEVSGNKYAIKNVNQNKGEVVGIVDNLNNERVATLRKGCGKHIPYSCPSSWCGEQDYYCDECKDENKTENQNGLD